MRPGRLLVAIDLRENHPDDYSVPLVRFTLF